MKFYYFEKITVSILWIWLIIVSMSSQSLEWLGLPFPQGHPLHYITDLILIFMGPIIIFSQKPEDKDG